MARKRGIRRPDADPVVLYRGGAIVSSLLGAFSSSLRETRITAMLGYLISKAPEAFLKLFGARGAQVLSVSLEHRHELDRSDILMDTTAGVVVIEAKVGAEDTRRQVLKYGARKSVVLSDRIPTLQESRDARVRHVHWKQLATVVRDLSRGSAPAVRFLCDDLIQYLEAHKMLRPRESVEVYAREINEVTTLKLFLKARMYGCQHQVSSRLGEALYFAPHFGKAIAHEYPGIEPGVSHLAKIEDVVVVETHQDLVAAIDGHRGKAWRKSHREYLDSLRSWSWRGKRYSFLLLGEPRLVFNPPIKKGNLQGGSGWLSKRMFSFDELFEAWSK